MREFSIVLLSALVPGDNSAARALELLPPTTIYRSVMVNSKLFVGKVFLRIKWKFELNITL